MSIAEAVHHQQQLLAAGALGNILEGTGACQCIFFLGHLTDQGHMAHLLRLIAGGGNGGFGQQGDNLTVRVAQLAQGGNDRYHVIKVGNAVGDEPVSIIRVAFPQGHSTLFHADVGGQIVAVR